MRFRRVTTVLCLPILAAGALALPTAAAAAAATATSASGAAGTFVPVTPTRVLDTKTALGTAAPGPSGTAHLPVLGRGPVPTAGVTAVVLTVTVVSPATHGYLTVYPDGVTRPSTSNVNFGTGRTQADQVYVPVGSNGKIALYNGSQGAVRLVGDVTGYFAAASARPAGSFVATTPTRVLDTRSTHAVAARSALAVPMLGQGPVPATGVSAVAFTLTALSPQQRGYVTVHADGTSLPPTSNLDFAAGQGIGNLVISQVGADGKVAVYNGSAGSVQFVADVAGYFTGGSPTAPGAYVPVTPSRTLTQGTVSARHTVGVSARQVLATGVASASVLNVTASGATKNGYATAYGGSTRRTVSSLSFAAGSAIAGLAVTAGEPHLGHLYNGSAGSVRFTADFFGYYIAAPGLGAITGRLTDATSGSGIGAVDAFLFTNTGGDPDYAQYGHTTTTADGDYSFGALPPDLPYYVCWDTLNATQPDPSSGYQSRCSDGAVWISPGYDFDQNDGAPIGLTVDHTTVVDRALPRIDVGVVSGRLETSDGTALAHVQADFSRHGVYQDNAVASGADGNYRIELPLGTYDVCFDPILAGSGSVTYAKNCPADPITITAGSTPTLDAVLLANGSIGGRVVAASGKQIRFGGVSIYSRAGNYVGGAELSSAGYYTAPEIPPGSYTVCFSGGDPLLNPPYGFVDECYDDVVAASLEAGRLPAGTTPVRVAEGARVTLNATLATAGGISGTLTRASDGAPLEAVRVDAFDAATGRYVSNADTDADGHYLVPGLPPSASGYRICFDPTLLDPAYHPQCYRNVPWDKDASRPPPADATPVPVTGNATHTGIDAVITG